MTPRQRLLVRYSATAAVLMVLILAAVAMVEALRSSQQVAGIEDILARDLPAGTPTTHFNDATARAGIAFRHFPLERSRLLPEDMGSGVAWGDCDNDGFVDLYAVNFVGPLDASVQQRAGGTGNALYRNRGDGTFGEIGEAAGVALKAFGMGAAWADYDGDGDLDLYVTNYGPNALLRNDGGCRFTDVTTSTGVGGGDAFSAGATWGDYDGDGDLDLYVTNYVAFRAGDRATTGTAQQQYGLAVPYTLNPASYEPTANFLFRNDGDQGFAEVADVAGVANAAGRSLSAAWADWDADGDVDLYVANDISDNAFYLNLGDGTFADISTASLTADYRGAMGLAVSDYDRDGDLDFFVTHWIAQENALFENHASADARDPLLFTDVADVVGLGATGLDYVGWGTSFVDYDNDGWKDLFVANGHTLEDPADTSRLLPQPMKLFWNRGKEGFFDVSEAAGPSFGRLLVARGAAAADYDRDGDVDIAVLENGGELLLLENSGSPAAHWVEIDLIQDGANVHALGALIQVLTGNEIQHHAVGASPSYLSQDSVTAHFGLGASAIVGRIIVNWPGGERETWTNVGIDAIHTLRRGGGKAYASAAVNVR